MSDDIKSKPTKNANNIDSKQWFVRMSNGSVFGPINTKGLIHWVCDGRVMPDDEISEDRIIWRASRDLPELEMNVMLERPDGTFVGPFNERAINPLIQEGKIPPKSKRFHVDELEERMNNRQMALFGDEAWSANKPDSDSAEEIVYELDESENSGNDGNAQVNIEEIQKKAEAKVAEERRNSEAKVAEEKRASEAKIADEKRAFEAKVAEEKRNAEKAISEIQKKAEVSIAEERRAFDALIAEEKRASEAKVAEAKRSADEAKKVAEESTAEAVKENEELKRSVAEANEKLSAVKQELINTQHELAELLEFSNKRDSEFSKKIQELSELAIEDSNDDDTSGGVVSARRVKELEGKVLELITDRNLLREKLEEVSATNAMSERPLEGDIALIKTFAEEAVNSLQKILEQEKEANTVARTASAERQKELHSEIEHLARLIERDPGEKTRSEQIEERNEKHIAKLQQELDSMRRLHQADMARADENEKAAEQRYKALLHKASSTSEKLSRIEQRTADYDSLANQLRRRETAMLDAEKEFEKVRQQWQTVEAALQNRIAELEASAGSLFDEKKDDQQLAEANQKTNEFKLTPWMRRGKI